VPDHAARLELQLGIVSPYCIEIKRLIKPDKPYVFLGLLRSLRNPGPDVDQVAGQLDDQLDTVLAIQAQVPGKIGLP